MAYILDSWDSWDCLCCSPWLVSCPGVFKVIKHLEGVQKDVRASIDLFPNWRLQNLKKTPKLSKIKTSWKSFLIFNSNHQNYKYLILMILNLYFIDLFCIVPILRFWQKQKEILYKVNSQCSFNFKVLCPVEDACGCPILLS